jgi:hypothetical protein
MCSYDFDIAVFAVNEASTILGCISSVDKACAGHKAHISVLLNGTTDDSIGILKRHRLEHAAMTVYRFSVSDKANAINHFIYSLRQDTAVHFAIDGYVRIGPESLEAMRTALIRQPRAHLASSIQLTGRSAKSYAAAVLRGGAVTGQLFAMRRDFTDRIVASGYRLPLQIYRGDGLLGSMAAHDLDPMNVAWENDRIIGVAEAQFKITPLSAFRLRDVKRQFQREIRQARGRMENEAIKSIIYTEGYAALPANANAMLREWLANNRPRPRSVREEFFTRLALRQLARSPDIDAVAPETVFSSEAR